MHVFKMVVVSFFLISNGVDAQDTKPEADLVVTNASIYTMNERQPQAQAVAIKDGRFVYVGSSQGVKAYIRSETKVLNAEHQMLMPGINDAHIHPILGGIKDLYECNFPFSATAQLIAQSIATCVEKNPEAEWIVGGQWDSGFFDNNHLESPKEFLDKVSGNKAIYLSDDSTHNAWVNSKALLLAGINKDTVDPSGGEFVRDDKTGEPNGILLESATKLLYKSVPDWSANQYQNAVKHVVKTGHSFGITGMKDAGSPINGMAAYYALDQNNDLNMHMATSIRSPDGHRNVKIDYDAIDQLRDRYKSTNVHTEFVKIFVDGVPTSSHTAAMLDHYVVKDGEKPTNGDMLLSPKLLSQDLIELDRRGYTVKIHTAGDRAVRVALDAIESARKANGDSGLRHELAHVGYVHKDDLPRFSSLNAVADLSPYLWHPSPLIDAIISAVGLPKAAKYWPVKTLLELKTPMLAGSDWPAAVASMNPWLGIEAMVTRKDPLDVYPGELWAEQAISLEQVLKIFTIDGAKALKLERLTGSVEVGKSADFIVLKQNIFEIPPEQISDTQVELTVFNGQLVYQYKQK